MSHFLSSDRFGVALMTVVLACAWFLSCSSHTRGASSKELNRAIDSFIAGDYEAAAEKLEKLSGDTDSEEELREIYLYLGRSYMALEQYSRAIDAFSAGRAHGGGGVFEEYLLRAGIMVSASPENVSKSIRVTRGQLAALIDGMFYDGVGDIGVPGAGTGKTGMTAQLQTVRRGVLPALADGEFHAGAFVTRAAFYAAVSRLVKDKGTPGDPSLFFAGGFDWVLQAAESAETRARIEYVTGKETVVTLQRVAEVVQTNGG